MMVTWWQAALLGILQGATEFLPISSSGHLVLVPWLLGWKSPSLAFDAMLHLGTAVAVAIYFRDDLIDLVRGGLHILKEHDLKDKNARLLTLIIVGSIPAALAGFLLEDFFAGIFENPPFAAVFLLVTAALLFAAERIGKLARSLDALTLPDSVVIGVAQAFAIFPGISRSGSTIAAGLARSLDRTAAARFSFLLSVPVVAGAGLFKLKDLLDVPDLGAALPAMAGGFIAALVVGYLCIAGLLRYLRGGRLLIFSAYCALFGTFCLIVAAARV
jgi:undecaprenyl-diphosphatase